jgi:cytochrome d ubiquinol oxidase subunit II
LLNTIGPVWEGNQVWLILGAGAIFAAWPEIYAVAFSGFYFAMLLVLFALILRPVAFKYRSKIANPRWQTITDIAILISGFVPAFIFGVAIGNILQGVPFHFDSTLRSFYTGNLLELLNPFALLVGFTSVFMLMMHGSLFLGIKTTGIIQQRATLYTYLCAALTLIFFAVCGYCIASHVSGYALTQTIPFDGPSNPLHKIVTKEIGGWLDNYAHYPWLMLVPTCGFVGVLLAAFLTWIHFPKLAWLANALGIAGIITTVGVSMFPFILPSSSDPNMSLLVWDASSSHMTLFIMLIASLIFLPLIILYTSWVYYVLRGKVTAEYINENSQQVY